MSSFPSRPSSGPLQLGVLVIPPCAAPCAPPSAHLQAPPQCVVPCVTASSGSSSGSPSAECALPSTDTPCPVALGARCRCPECAVSPFLYSTRPSHFAFVLLTVICDRRQIMSTKAQETKKKHQGGTDGSDTCCHRQQRCRHSALPGAGSQQQ